MNVMGLGATGLSLVRHLRKHGATVRVFDGNTAAQGRQQLTSEFPDVSFDTCDFATEALPKADLIALSPGVPRATHAILAAAKHGIPVKGDIELFAQENRGYRSVFAVTGSNGKTTTVQIAGAIAKSADATAVVAGNIGLPVLDALSAQPTARTWVLELSSFQLESTDSLDCENATVLNVTDNHLDRYPSFFAYAASKERVFINARRQLINRDDPWSLSMRRPSLPQTSFGAGRSTRESDYGVKDDCIARGETPLIAIDSLQIRGAHNVMNAMAAVALLEPLEVPNERVQRAVSEFTGVPHRYQWLGNVGGVEIINDSKATTVVAASAALRASRAPTWLIAGGDGKAQSFEPLAAAAAGCRGVHLIGRDAAAIAHALELNGVTSSRFERLEDATIAALERARPGDRVLLAPACASWDMFRSFEHRADVFAETVRAWASSMSRTLTKDRTHA